MADMQARINSLSGGAPIAQADTMAIAKRLLGPDLAERYGDVVGARDTSLADVARDFAVGAISKDPFKADQLKNQVYQQYQTQLRAEEDQAMQKEEAARQQVDGWFKLLDAVKKQPKELRAPLLKNGAASLGIDISSEYLTKLITQYEKFGKTSELLTDPGLQELMMKNPVAAVEQLVKMGADDTEAAGAVMDLLKLQHERESTQLVIAQAAKTAREQPANSPANLRNFRVAAENELRARRLGEASADNPTLQTFLDVDDDQLRRLALRGGRAEKTGSSDPIMDAIMSELTGKPSGKPSPAGGAGAGGITVRRKGIPQAAATPAPAAPVATAAVTPEPAGIPQSTVPTTTTTTSTTLPPEPAGLEKYLGE